MALISKTFRIFVSSTFSDLKEERNALQRHVFTKLRDLCTRYGCRFQAIDLRWGVSGEAALDQQTMNICLQELKRCRSITPRPNFIVLLGDRYGWCPLPPQIEAKEFEAILDEVSSQEKELLLWDETQPAESKGWYRRDENADSAEYCLRPIEIKVPDNASDEERKAVLDSEAEDWGQIEKTLRASILQAINKLGWSDDDSRRIKFEASATHQEILQGALDVPNTHEHVYCFFRKIEGLPEDSTARDFIDLDESEHLDSKSQQQLESLKESLRRHLPGNIFEYKAKWTGSCITYDYIERMCQDVYNVLSRLIVEEATAFRRIDILKKEIEDHESFGKESAKFFTGRTNILQSIRGYLNSANTQPLLLFGESGSGKTALMAHAVIDAQEAYPDAEVVVRFIGATPSSANGRSLLETLCHQISHCYDTDETAIPIEYLELVQEFLKRLELVTKEKPLILFLDALDQLSNTDHARNLTWLPANLPEHVHLIVSSLPGECFTVLEKKLPLENLVELGPMPLQEGEKLLALWLKDTGRTLQAHQRSEVICKFKQCGLPLYLKLAFEEARRWKSYAEKTELSQGIPGVIRDLFGQLSSEANHGKIMFSRTMGYLAAAKNGLAEDELLDVLSRDSNVMTDFKRRSPKSPDVEILPVVVWSRLYFDLESYLTECSADGTSLMTFYHRQLGEVARDEYLTGEENQCRHSRLAQYFAAQALQIEKDNQKIPNLRKLSELPYHQAQARMWAELEATLTDLAFLAVKSSHGLTWELMSDFAYYPRDLPSERGLVVRMISRLLAPRIGWLAQSPQFLISEIVTELSCGPSADLVQGVIEQGLGMLAESRQPYLNPQPSNISLLGEEVVGEPVDAAVSPNERLLAIVDDTCCLSVIEIDSESLLWRESLPGKPHRVWFAQWEEPVICVVATHGIRVFHSDGSLVRQLGDSQMTGESGAGYVLLVAEDQVAILNHWIRMNASSDAEMEPWRLWNLRMGSVHDLKRVQVPSQEWCPLTRKRKAHLTANEVTVWDSSTAKEPVWRMTVLAQEVKRIWFSGQPSVALGSNGRVWNIQNGKIVGTLQLGDLKIVSAASLNLTVGFLMLLSDGSIVRTDGKRTSGIIKLNVSTLEKPQNIVVSPDDRFLYACVGGHYGGALLKYDLVEEKSVWQTTASGNSITLSEPGDDRIVCGSTILHGSVVHTTSGTARVHCTDDGQMLSEEIHGDSIIAVAYHSRFDVICLARGNGDLDIRDHEGLKSITVLPADSEACTHVVCHPLHPIVATCGFEGMLRIWHLRAKTLLYEKLLGVRLAGLRFVDDESYIMLASPYPTFLLYSLENFDLTST